MTDGTTPRDPLRDLSHDHGQLGALVLAARGVLVAIDRDELPFEDGVEELASAVETLRHALLSHFAREEEGFFPFVETQLPALKARVEKLRTEHDAVCQGLEELARVVRQSGREGVGYALWLSSFERFEGIYAAHAQSELALLTDVGASLDGDARDRLRTILAEI